MADDFFPYTPLEVMEYVMAVTHLSQNEVARRAGLSKDTMTNIRKTKNSSKATVRKLLGVIGLTPRDFAALMNGHPSPAAADVRSTRLHRSLDAKLVAEYSHCDLIGSAWEPTVKQIVDRVDRLRVLGVHTSNVLWPVTWARSAAARLDSLPRSFPADGSGQLRGTLRVSVPVIEVGSVAAILGLMKACDTCSIELDYSHVNGADQINSIRRGGDDFDFAVFGIAAFAFGCTGYSPLAKFGLLTPIHSIRQHVVAHDHRMERLKRVYVCPGGFAEFQARLNESLPGGYHREDVSSTSPLPIATKLDDGEGVIAYEPVGETIRRNNGMQRVEGTGFSIHIGLFASKRHLGTHACPPRGAKLGPAFLHAFTAEYLRNRAYPERALELLCADEGFCRRYALAAGVPHIS